MREISIIKQNILQYLDFKKVSKYEFYQKTGASNGILSQSNGISEDNILKFLSYYTDINPEWLLTGQGSMLKKEMDLVVIQEDFGKIAGLERENALKDTIIESKDKIIESLERENQLLRLISDKEQHKKIPNPQFHNG